jgi:uncharacterized protein DUF3144
MNDQTTPETDAADENEDPGFYDRADAHIMLANEQAEEADAGAISASMMFASARYGAWLAATGFESGADMQADRDEHVAYFVEQFKLMIEDNLDDYIANFDVMMKDEDGEDEK